VIRVVHLHHDDLWDSHKEMYVVKSVICGWGWMDGWQCVSCQERVQCQFRLVCREVHQSNALTRSSKENEGRDDGGGVCGFGMFVRVRQ
jgi:hypothetical protein